MTSLTTAGQPLALPEMSDFASEGVARYAIDGALQYCNSAWTTLHGMDRAPEASSVWAVSADPRFAEDIWRKTLVAGQWQGVVKRRLLDGTEISVSIRLAVRRDDHGCAIDVVEFGQDASSDLSSSGARPIWELEASELRYQQLIHYIPVPLLKVDSRAAGEIFGHLKADGVDNIVDYLANAPHLVELAKDVVLVTSANTEVGALFGVEPDALVGPVRFLFEGTPEAAARVMAAHFNGARNHTEELKIRRFDGTTRDVVFLVTYPAPNQALDTTLIMMIDITERLATEAQLQRLEADYTHAARLSSLGEMASSIAHEIKQPLSAILTNGETTLRWLGQSPPNISKALELTDRIVDSAQRASEIIQRIRGMSIKTSPVRDRLDLNTLVEEGLRFVKYDLDHREVRVSRQFQADLPPLIGDRVQLQQVVVNLLMNALQALIHAPLARRSIQITTRLLPGARLELQVQDGGPGIAPEDLGQVFESFFSTKTGGIGIGLSICRSIITAHGGDVSVSNSEGGGACFSVRLPASLDEQASV